MTTAPTHPETARRIGLAEASWRVGLAVPTLRKWCVAGRLPSARRVGRRWTVDVRDVDALLGGKAS